MPEEAYLSVQETLTGPTQPDRFGPTICPHPRTVEIGVKFYFALPHRPWQRNTIENNNGVLREHFPKGESLARVSEKRVCRRRTISSTASRANAWASGRRTKSIAQKCCI